MSTFKIENGRPAGDYIRGEKTVSSGSILFKISGYERQGNESLPGSRVAWTPEAIAAREKLAGRGEAGLNISEESPLSGGRNPYLRADRAIMPHLNIARRPLLRRS